MLTSLNEWEILDWDEKTQKIIYARFYRHILQNVVMVNLATIVKKLVGSASEEKTVITLMVPAWMAVIRSTMGPFAQKVYQT